MDCKRGSWDSNQHSHMGCGRWSCGLGHRAAVPALAGLEGWVVKPGVASHGAVPCSLLKSAPKVLTTPVKAKRVSTFQEFESNTSDAWDAGEDDDQLLAMAAESLNTEVVMETAHRVLRDHSQRQGQHPPQEASAPEAELPAAPGADLRLVKSVSESHAACPAGRRGGQRGARVQGLRLCELPEGCCSAPAGFSGT